MKDVLDRAQKQGFGFLVVVLTVPVALPITPPGLSVPFGILLLGLAIQLILKRETPWFPKWVLRKEVKSGEDGKLIRMIRWLVRLFEKFLKPRQKSVFSPPALRAFIGPVLMACSLGMMTVGPTSWLPAVGAFLLGLGMMEEDGLFGWIGGIVGVIGLFVAIAGMVAVIYFGVNIDEFLPEF